MKFELNEYHHNASDDELITDLKRVAQRLRKEAITPKEYTDHGKYWAQTLRRRFGSWHKAIEKAGLKKVRPCFTDEDIFENLLNVWTHYGRQPLRQEMNIAPSNINWGVYQHRFGRWRKALEAFVVRMNQDNGSGHPEEPRKGDEGSPSLSAGDSSLRPSDSARNDKKGEGRRGIPLGLRYRVLSRDKFKCKCGRSPATDPAVRLHIDHIIPFSKGGKTVLENLQTLCEDCNLGKGNRHSE